MAFPYDGPYGRGKRVSNVSYGRTPYNNVGFRPLKKNPYNSGIFMDPGGGGSKDKSAPTAAAPTSVEDTAVGSNLMDYGPDDDQQQVLPSAGGAGNVDRSSIAQGFGYEKGTGNFGGLGSVLGMATGIPGLGAIASKSMDALGLPGNYGNMGTTDAMGNVFGAEGRAYDPITGQAVGSYGNAGDWWDATSGGYGQLRDAGGGVVESALGSYENSIVPYGGSLGNDPTDPTNVGARGARLRGGDYERTGTMSTAGLINQNTFGINEGYGQGQVDPAFVQAGANMNPQHDISAEQLGFTNQRAYDQDLVNNNSGQWGTGAGDIAATEFGPGVITDSGQIQHGGGTVVALTNTADPTQGNISLLSDSPTAKAEAQAELGRRAGNEAATSYVPDNNNDNDNNNSGPGTVWSNDSGSSVQTGYDAGEVDPGLAKAAGYTNNQGNTNNDDGGGGGGGGGGK